MIILSVNSTMSVSVRSPTHQEPTGGGGSPGGGTELVPGGRGSPGGGVELGQGEGRAIFFVKFTFLHNYRTYILIIVCCKS